jgi:AraC-like DNA-binding protein
MLNTPTALAVTATPLKEALRAYGIDFNDLARRAGLDPFQLAQPNARYPAARIQKLWALAGEASADPLFGFRVGALTRPGTFHALGLGIVASTSVIAALRRIERYSSVVSTNGRFHLRDRDGLVSLESEPHELAVMPTTHCVDAMVVAVCRMLEQCAGPSAVPERVVFMRPRSAPPEAYRDLLKCEVQFDGPRIALQFDAAMAARPVLSGNTELAAEADKLSERYLAGLAQDPTVARVRSLLLRAIPSGQIDQDEIARSLNQSASTLQRRLRRAGTRYQDVLDATRRELAFAYLEQGEYGLADIAFLLGFTDQANFTRAFRRWTGETPRTFLSRHAAGQSALAAERGASTN